MAVNNALNQMNLTDTHRSFHPKEAKCTFFSNAHGIFSKIDHMMGHKTSLNKFKEMKIIENTISKHKGLNLETKLKEKTQKHSNPWRLNSMNETMNGLRMRSRNKSKNSGHK